MRWIFSIVVCVAFAAGLVLLSQSLQAYETAKGDIVTLQAERSDYDKLKAIYDAEEEKVAIVNALWDDLQKVNLKPEDWTTYPLSVAKVLDWKEVEKLMVLSSNRLDQDAGYYFRPEMLRISRVLVNPEDQGQEGEPAAQAQAVATGEDPGLLPLQKYDTTLRGAFLIPKSE